MVSSSSVLSKQTQEDCAKISSYPRNDTDGWSYNNDDKEKEKCLHIKILYKQTYSKHSKQFEKAPGLLLMHTRFAMQMIFLGKKS